jgi:antitoxin component of RelBE/YafQ-DinJ toxin-antitoxin module
MSVPHDPEAIRHNEIRAEAIAQVRQIRLAEEQGKFDKGQEQHRAAQQRELEQWQARQASEQQQRSIAQYEQRARAGDRAAADELANYRTAEALRRQGRTQVLNEIGNDISQAISGLDIDADSKARLMMAPSVAAFATSLHGMPKAVQRKVEKSLKDYAPEVMHQLGYDPAWKDWR